MNKKSRSVNELPHFLRAGFILDTGFFEPKRLLQAVVKSYPDAQKFLGSRNQSSYEMRERLYEKYGARALIEMGYEINSSYETGILPYVFRHLVNDSPHYVVSNELDKELRATKLNKMPENFFNLKENIVYLEFTEDHSSDLRVFSAEEGVFYPFNGAYISVYDVENKDDAIFGAFRINGRKKMRVIQVAIIGSPNGADKEAADDAFIEHTMLIDFDESLETDLTDVMEWFNTFFIQASTAGTSEELLKEAEFESKKIFEHIFKAVMLLETGACLKEKVDDRTSMLRMANRTLSPKKRKMMMEEANKYSDHILLKPISK